MPATRLRRPSKNNTRRRLLNDPYLRLPDHPQFRHISPYAVASHAIDSTGNSVVIEPNLVIGHPQAETLGTLYGYNPNQSYRTSDRSSQYAPSQYAPNYTEQGESSRTRRETAINAPIGRRIENQHRPNINMSRYTADMIALRYYIHTLNMKAGNVTELDSVHNSIEQLLRDGNITRAEYENARLRMIERNASSLATDKWCWKLGILRELHYADLPDTVTNHVRNELRGLNETEINDLNTLCDLEKDKNKLVEEEKRRDIAEQKRRIAEQNERECREIDSLCTISGGKHRKSRKTKKSRRTKKSRKTNKFIKY